MPGAWLMQPGCFTPAGPISKTEAFLGLHNVQLIATLNADRQAIGFHNSIRGPDQLRQRVISVTAGA